MATREVIAVIGVTAGGKTALGEALAESLGGEIVCADSRQVFAELEVGTGKPDVASRERLPHHLFDARRLGERVSAGWYAERSAVARRAIHGRSRIPILVGGSGLWLRAAAEGLAPEPPHDAALRARLVTEAETRGTPALHARLASVDPAAAARLHPHDTQRVTRALEVAESGGRPQSDWHREQTPPGTGERWHSFELVVEPAVLRARIRERAEWMFAHGLLEETRALLEGGSADALRALHAIGYDEAIACLEDRCPVGGAIERTAQRTAQLAKRQRTWFRHQSRATRLCGEPFDPRKRVDEIRALLPRDLGQDDSGAPIDTHRPRF
jgi:tRNA dimethylallyltransferase